MTPLTLGVVAHSRKENELRLALHPRHLAQIPDDLRARVFLEHGYGERFGLRDAQVAPWVGGLRTREQLLAGCDVILAPKPLAADVAELREGQTLWGWPHCVQDPQITQLAIDRRLTLIAFEAMNHWSRDGAFNLHVFHKNNELAGYSSVLHAMQLAGIAGDYGPRLRAVVIGFGATARGAVTALDALGVHDVDVLTHRHVAAVAAPIHSARIVHLDDDHTGERVSHAVTAEGRVPLPAFLGEHDVVVNCVLQDVAAPLTFMTDDDLGELSPGTVVVDVSCDEGMGFTWARPTTFDEPTFTVGDGVLYYGVDHSPSYLWNSATWEISAALLPFLGTVMGGREAWESNETISRAIEIHDGVVRNPAVLAFQGRDAAYPHTPRVRDGGGARPA
ncbi:alanine dehydrogenase [Sediminihabitans luteus]|uniref:Alanine dehydrogenase n=1 Tax=Sediminihabitans luteus TaxID=1138585 RepID=A0A2M9CQN1_9CELL|nr:N(5)-(carboxyethyl)ornithine synthase [Sediminihabitans luteus]PJJ74197.1 alanine dehydrogenase [Sediminihabitans luteus]GII99050.1 alanine dehydrogenase [Sediminihabitans luteus]